MKVRSFLFATMALWGVATYATVWTGDDDDTKASAKIAESEIPESSIIDEVIWVVGDEMIMKSDVEQMRMQAQMEGATFSGNPDCTIPEQIAVQKLFLHQAAIDSIEVSEGDIASDIEAQINYWISMIGSREKLEEYKRQSISQMRAELHDQLRDRQLIQRMREKLVEDITATPSEVRQYFATLPADSLPYVPTNVEVQIITMAPKIPIEEIEAVKEELRSYTERVNNGSATFASLARLYSEDPGSARQGGEMDYMGRGMLDQAFANVAFNLTDPKKVSKIVESEFGYHIIQLIDKRGDKIKCRHILRKPNIPQEAIDNSIHRLDSLANDIRSEKFTFDAAASYLSDDKDTRNNNGVMYNTSQSGARTSRFMLSELPSEVAKVVDTLQVGQVSNAFTMVNSRGKTVSAIVKLKNRIDGHRATMTGDYQTLKEIVVSKRKMDFLQEWVTKKLKGTYVQMKNNYCDCEFEYQGWIK